MINGTFAWEYNSINTVRESLQEKRKMSRRYFTDCEIVVFKKDRSEMRIRTLSKMLNRYETCWWHFTHNKTVLLKFKIFGKLSNFTLKATGKSLFSDSAKEKR